MLRCLRTCMPRRLPMLIQMLMELFIKAIVKHGQVDKMLDCKVEYAARLFSPSKMTAILSPRHLSFTSCGTILDPSPVICMTFGASSRKSFGHEVDWQQSIEVTLEAVE